MSKKTYGIGLDIGTNSVGFSVVDEEGHIIRIKGHKAIGVRLFSEGQAAADRRGFRTARRRLKRKRWRLGLLREIFDSYVSSVDANFFRRLKYFDESPKDPTNHGYDHQLFSDKSDKEFYTQYPTIYHLRHALKTEHRQFDIREIYLAVHHIVKNRGHFLTQGNTNDFKSRDINVDEIIREISSAYKVLFQDDDFELIVDSGQRFKNLLADYSKTRSDRSKSLNKLLSTTHGDAGSDKKATDKKYQSLQSNIGKAVVGLSAQFNELLGVDVPSDSKTEWKTSFDTIDDWLADHENDLVSEEQFTILSNLRKLFGYGILADLVPQDGGISEGMIEKYKKHAEDLKLLKEYASKQDKATKRAIKDAYGAYINGVNSKPVSYENFSKTLNKLVDDDSADANYIRTQLELGKFLPKQRSKENTVLPHQLQQLELDEIIDNQKEFYPWLGEANPVVEDARKGMPYKLDELVGFRVPYYVGPMITEDKQASSSNAKFAWMVRKNDARITPWNFDQVVDREQSATNFIERMRTTDTYLLGEEVLPASSLLYQEFTVLNELNNVRINGEHLSVSQKERLIEQLFKRKKTVRIKDMVENLEAAGETLNPEVEGLADPKHFLSGLSTYNDFKHIIPDQIDKQEFRDDIEKIISWSTLFEDSGIRKIKLNELVWLTEEQRKIFASKRYVGWGKLSRKLLSAIQDAQGHSVMYYLKNTSKNFMQIVHDDDFAESITKYNKTDLTGEQIIDEAYTSPANRKGIRQVLAVVRDIEKAVGYAPTNVYIEAADGPQNRGGRTVRREDRLLAVYKDNAHELAGVYKELQSKVDSKVRFNDKLVLYFMQAGKDIYTGDNINIDGLANYDIDHIIPQSLIKDDSFDNRVLTKRTINEGFKETNFASEEFPQRIGEWERMCRMGLISPRKLRNLKMYSNEINKYQTGFVRRQLVETRQVVKLAEQVLTAELPKGAKVINIKASLSHDFRKEFGFPKNRSINDYHHAFDAHLAAFLGTYLQRQFPKLAGMYEYDNFTKVDKHNLGQTNFIGGMKYAGNGGRRVNTDGEVTWNKQSDIEELRKIYSYKQMLVSYETFENHGALNDQTRYKAKDAAVNGGTEKKLVPARADRPVDIYGGFKGSKVAYLAIARLDKKSGPQFVILPIYVRDLQGISQAKSNGLGAEKKYVEKLVKPNFTKVGKDGSSKVSPYRVILPHVKLGTMFSNQDKGSFRLVSETEYRNCVQIAYPLSFVEKLYSSTTSSKDFDFMLGMVIRNTRSYNTLLLSNVDKLEGVKERYAELPVGGRTDEKGSATKRGVLITVLDALHANANRENLGQIGVSGEFGRVRNSGGIKLSGDTIIKNCSSSGLFRHEQKLSDL